MAIRDISDSGSNQVRKEPTGIRGIYRLIPDNDSLRDTEVNAEVRKLLKERLSKAKFGIIEAIIEDSA